MMKIPSVGKHPIPDLVSMAYHQFEPRLRRPKPMYTPRKILAGFLVLAASQFVSTGCVGVSGGGGDDGGVYYGGDPWIQNDVIVTGGGRGWFGDHHDDRKDDHGNGGYVHPSGGDRGRHPAPAPAHPSGGASHPSGGDHGGDRDHKG